ncbi:MAG: tyrosine-type recombinase/integrase [Chloroflexi bacterium]|nr:tyrosine-type recombinase/integrase [Chloroflexota bacterium]
MSERRTEGRVEWRSNGCLDEGHKHSRCSFRIRVHAGFAGKRRLYLEDKGRGNQRDAERALRGLLVKRDTGTAAAPGSSRLTLGEWLDTWLATRVANETIRATTAQSYRGLIARHIRPALGDKRVTALHTGDVEAFRLGLTGLQPATVLRVMAVLSGALRAAVRSKKIATNPAQGVERPSIADRPGRRALDEGDVRMLLAAVSGTAYDVPVRFSIATGVRQSELLGLAWQNVDLDAKNVRIVEALHRVDGEFTRQKPKSRAGTRMIALSDNTVALLKRHKSAQNAERLRMGSVWEDNDLVFPGPLGSPQHRRSFLAGYQRLVTDSEISDPESVNWHTLRHSAGSLWLAGGSDVRVITERLGHSKVSFTMDTYMHALASQQAKAAQSTDHLLAESV